MSKPIPSIEGLNKAQQPKQLEILTKRTRRSPVDQRSIFCQEFPPGTEIMDELNNSMHQLNISELETSSFSVISMNAYYGRIQHQGRLGSETIKPTYIMEVVKSMLKSGVDAICLQEVVLGHLEQLKDGKEEYPGWEFKKEDFDIWKETIEGLIQDAEGKYAIIEGAATPSCMFKNPFGNMVLINTEKFNVKGTTVVPQLLEPTPEDPEGRSAIFVELCHKTNPDKRFVLVNTHLTERQVDAPGQRQALMMNELLKHLKIFNNQKLPTIICGDFNINDARGLPEEVSAWCLSNPYLHVNEEYDLYKLLRDNGFKTFQEYATKEGITLSTCWNGGVVDCICANGLKPAVVSVLDPVHQGVIMSDHKFPFVSYNL